MHERQFHQDVERAGRAQEWRAQVQAHSVRRSGVTSNHSYSPAHSSAASVANSLSSSLVTPSKESIFAPPPGSVQPRRVLPFRHPVNHEVPVEPVNAGTYTDGQSALSCSRHPLTFLCLDAEQAAAAKSAMTANLLDYSSSNSTTPCDSRAPSPVPAHKDTGSRRESKGTNQINQQTDVPAFVGIGRFRHASCANPEFIKAKLENELHGAGGHNFFGPDSKLGVHPLAQQYAERRKSVETEDSTSTRTRSPSPVFENAPTRLERKFRTQSSTTISADGCIIQRGFDISPRPSTPASTACTSPNSSPTAEPRKHPPMPSRRITWDERTIARFDNDDFDGVGSKSRDQEHSSPKPHSGKSHPLHEREEHVRAGRAGGHGEKKGKRSRSEQSSRKPMAQDVSGETWTADSTVTPTPRRELPKVQIVPADEAENAIATDDEDEQENNTQDGGTLRRSETMQQQQPTPLKPSKRLSPPTRGILKKSAERALSTANDAGHSSTSAEAADALLDSDRATAKPVVRQQAHFAQQQQQQQKPNTVVHKRAVSTTAGRRGTGHRGGLRVH